MERDNGFGFLSAFALGGIAGAALALLYAPRRGDETRQIVRDGFRRGTELGREKLQQGADLAREKFQQGADVAREKLQQGVEYGRSVAQKVSAARRTWPTTPWRSPNRKPPTSLRSASGDASRAPSPRTSRSRSSRADARAADEHERRMSGGRPPPPGRAPRVH